MTAKPFWRIFVLCGLGLCGSAWVSAADKPGSVELPLSTWEIMQDELERSDTPNRPGVSTCPIRREIEGRFRKGLFHGSLTADFVVLDDRGHIRVPILDGSASVGKVLINGKRTSLLREGDMYTLGVDEPGDYRVQIEMFLGKEQDRFARRLSFRLPEAGATRLSVHIPEKDIQAQLSHGALVKQESDSDGTRIEGHLDANGLFDLTWNRRLTHRSGEEVRLQAQLNSLFTVRESMVTGLAVFDLNVLEGETDRVDLRLPSTSQGLGLEILSVEGDAVLQWRTDAQDTSRLAVLLRYLVEDNIRVAVRFQFPADPEKPIDLRMPMPEPDTALSGAVGVLGPAGLNILVEDIRDAEQPQLRDLPPELTELTASPLQHGFTFSKAPRIRVRVEAHEALSQQATTLVDEMQASTVLLEDGSEITKLKLRIRNNARQYLAMRLPDGASLTHSLIDGRPVRPADVSENKIKVIKFPLRQSERLGDSGQRFHQVRSGETLSDIANFYYSNPDQWRFLLDNNEQLADATDLIAGQRLRIPAKQGVTIEESTFVIELAYKRIRDAHLGLLGSRDLDLPSVDVDVMRVIWHLYLPRAITPLSFDSNLTQHTAIRYDPFRRARDFLHKVFWERNAWANSKYQSILVQRKAIYKADYDMRASGKAVLATFPLVGERYRFKRTLMQREKARISVCYVADWVATPIRWLGFLAAFALTALLLKSRRRRWLHWLAAALGLSLLLWLAHYFLGTHRRILWGIDAALLLALLKLRGRVWLNGLRRITREPWTIVEHLRLRNLLFIMGLTFILWIALALPLLLSSLAMVVLALWWRRKARLARQEVAHV